MTSDNDDNFWKNHIEKAGLLDIDNPSPIFSMPWEIKSNVSKSKKTIANQLTVLPINIIICPLRSHTGP